MVEDLNAARANLFRVLLLRLRQLDGAQPAPSSYYLGKPYVEDPTRIPATIYVHFNMPGQVRPAGYWFRKAKISVEQIGQILRLRIDRKIPSKLWDDLRLLGKGRDFIIGYVHDVLPSVNERLINYRYADGHLLVRTFALFEATGVYVVCGNRVLQMAWPPVIAAFPPSQRLAVKEEVLYLRDLIDAMHALLRNEYDDCIRRIVTSAENLMRRNGWWSTKPINIWQQLRALIFARKRKSVGGFRHVLRSHIENTFQGTVVSENLDFVYSVRNRIVHGGFRMSVSSGTFCDKAVATLCYFIQRYSDDPRVSRYTHTLRLQLSAMRRDEYFNIDHLAGLYSRVGERKPIESYEEFELSMFQSLRFTARDKASIR